MDTFGKKIAALRKASKMSQAELAKALSTSPSVIGRYERDEMTPSIDAARKIAKFLDTTVGYLLGETEQEDLFKNPEMHKRLSEIEKMEAADKGHILSVIDGFIKSIKLKNIVAF
jgi:transcriptional regulator with XRE-family HTH domain